MKQINLPAYPREEIPRLEKFVLYGELIEKDLYLRENLEPYTIDDFIENKPINQGVQHTIRNMFMEKLGYKRN